MNQLGFDSRFLDGLSESGFGSKKRSKRFLTCFEMRRRVNDNDDGLGFMSQKWW